MGHGVGSDWRNGGLVRERIVVWCVSHGKSVLIPHSWGFTKPWGEGSDKAQFGVT